MSRFARNTLDSLKYIRALKELGIGIIFEKENINTLEMDTELIITFMSAFAQSESESISANVRWGKRQAMKEGKTSVNFKKLYGYFLDSEGNPRVDSDKAEVIRSIFSRYLQGASLRMIRQELEAAGIPNPAGSEKWGIDQIRNILSNEKYCGDVLMQKTFIQDCISKKVVKNTGQLPMYLIQNNHPAIVSREVYQAVQAEKARRSATASPSTKTSSTGRTCYASKFALSERLVCGECGTLYRRCTWKRNGKIRIVWRCVSRLDYGTKYCHQSPTMDEEPLQRAILAAISSVMAPREKINDFIEMTALSLTKSQALSLIEKIEFDEGVKQSFYKELNDNLYEKYQSFASNPLLLTIMLLTYNDHAVFPEKLNDFYEQAFSTLFNMHDATKESYVRDIRCELGCEDFKTIFSYICFKSYFGGEFEFSESKLREHIQKAKEKFPNIKFSVDDYQEDLTLSVCMLVKEGLVFRFAHRSFQEYFAALYTCKLGDEIQKKLLGTWMKESNACTTDSYLEMLFNMQGEKVNKLVFAPGIKEIKKLYEEKGFTISFLESFFEGIRTREPGPSRPDGAVSLIIGNSYLCAVMVLTCRLNSYPYYGEVSEHEKGVIETLVNSEKKKRYNKKYSFEKAIELVGEETLLDVLKWFEKQVLFVLKVLDKIENVTISNKKKVASILDAL